MTLAQVFASLSGSGARCVLLVRRNGAWMARDRFPKFTPNTHPQEIA